MNPGLSDLRDGVKAQVTAYLATLAAGTAPTLSAGYLPPSTIEEVAAQANGILFVSAGNTDRSRQTRGPMARVESVLIGFCKDCQRDDAKMDAALAQLEAVLDSLESTPRVTTTANPPGWSLLRMDTVASWGGEALQKTGAFSGAYQFFFQKHC